MFLQGILAKLHYSKLQQSLSRRLCGKVCASKLFFFPVSENLIFYCVSLQIIYVGKIFFCLSNAMFGQLLVVQQPDHQGSTIIQT